MRLVQSRVVFDQINHRYYLDGKQLRGVTGILSRQLFPRKYDDVPESVLANAKQRGDEVHAECELIDSLGIEPTRDETSNYIALRDGNGLTYEWGEYLISDNEHYASSIDKVYRVDDVTFDLGDIKTTYTLDKEYVSWQLSIYAYLFERQNEGARVRNLFAIWLYKDRHGEKVDVDRKPDSLVEALLRADIEGRQFEYDRPTVHDCTLPRKYADMAAAIKEIDAQAAYWADKRKELMAGVQKEMELAGVDKWEGMGLSFTRKKDTVRQSFDTAAFKRDHPKIYEEYVKTSHVKGSLTLKINE